MLPDYFKRQVIAELTAALPTTKSWLYVAFNDFIINKDEKKDKDYSKLVVEIKDIIKTNAIFMQAELGGSFEFFNSIKVLDERAENNMQRFNRDFIIEQDMHRKEPAGKNIWDMLLALSKKQDDRKQKIYEAANATVERHTHINNVLACYKDLKELVRNCLANTIPAANANPVELNNNSRKIYEMIGELATLACKELPTDQPISG